VDQFDVSLERQCLPFDISVILLNQVIKILVLPDSNGFLFRLVSAAVLAPLLSRVMISG
jgi:hypothetical protein